MSTYNKHRHFHVGIGGIHCPCCAPKHAKSRRAILRAGKRHEKAIMVKQVKEILAEDHWTE
jgi:hypothetical protein